MSLTDKTGSEMIRTFIKAPVSTINLIVILVIAVTWYNTREANVEKITTAVKAQDYRIERVEKKIEASDVLDIRQNAELQNQLSSTNNRLSVIETNVQWLVRAQGGPQRP